MEPQFEVLPPTGRPGPPPKPKTGIMGGGIAAVLVLLAKFKFLLLGGLKTGLSMFIMIWFYSMMFGWPFAAGLVLLILVHELGHVAAAMWLGIPVSAPIFIPFVGAAITMKQNPRDAWTEALMAYGGPLAGTAGGWAVFLAAVEFQQPWLIAVAAMTFFLNLFNLIPVPPLDGGRICAAVSPWFWLIGAVLLGGYLLYFHSANSIILLVLIFFFALSRLRSTLFQPPTPEMQRYYATSPLLRVSMALLYLLLAVVALYGYWDASEHLRYLATDGP